MPLQEQPAISPTQSEDFMKAKTFKDVRLAVEGWKTQYQIDDATGESYIPANNFSNFALLLAAMYKGQTQVVIQGTFNRLYDLIQGTQEPNLFEQPDNTPRTLAQAIKEVLNIDYNGQQGSNVLVGDTSTSQLGQQGGTGNAATGERTENGNRTADSAGSIGEDSRGIRSESEDTIKTETDNELTKLGVKVKEERTDDDNVRFEKTNGQDAVSQEEAALRDALIDKVREAGIDVITDTEEGQRVLDEANRDERLQAKRRALETASLESNSRSLTVVPSANGAKILNNLDKLTEDYDKKE